MHAWIDPHNPPIPDDVLQHCACLFATSLLLSSLILLSLCYVLRGCSRLGSLGVQLVFGAALLFASCRPSYESLLRARVPDDIDLPRALLNAIPLIDTATSAAVWYLAAGAGLIGWLIHSTRNRKPPRA